MLAGVFLFLASHKKRKVDLHNEIASDLATSHSRRNVRFNEKIRKTFRHRWLNILNSKNRDED